MLTGRGTVVVVVVQDVNDNSKRNGRGSVEGIGRKQIGGTFRLLPSQREIVASVVMMNYICKVEWTDPFPLPIDSRAKPKLTQVESQTSKIATYEIHNSEEFRVLCSLTIVVIHV